MKSLNDVLTYLDARTAEGLEQLKRGDATTESREQSFLNRLFNAERALKELVFLRWMAVIMSTYMGRRIPARPFRAAVLRRRLHRCHHLDRSGA